MARRTAQEMIEACRKAHKLIQQGAKTRDAFLDANISGQYYYAWKSKKPGRRPKYERIELAHAEPLPHSSQSFTLVFTSPADAAAFLRSARNE